MKSLDHTVYHLFTWSLVVSMLLSGYLFLRSIQMRDSGYVNTWQFPMLLALLFDHVYAFSGFSKPTKIV